MMMSGRLKQKIYQKTKHDCFHTALSCITGEPVDKMPYNNRSMTMLELRDDRWEQWQLRTGWGLKFWVGNKDYKRGEYYIGLYYITFVPGSHAVVCLNGNIVHNVTEGSDNRYLYEKPWGIVTVTNYNRKGVQHG